MHRPRLHCGSRSCAGSGFFDFSPARFFALGGYCNGFGLCLLPFKQDQDSKYYINTIKIEHDYQIFSDFFSLNNIRLVFGF